jgi:sarcosine oxidase subunit alpha
VRLPDGGRLDRNRELRFTVDGVPYHGFRGDTLASALVAAGAIRVGDSIHRRRPRGIFTADAGEPNALVEVAGRDAMQAATTVELVDGLRARLLSGLGRLDPADPGPTGHYDKKYVHADVAVVGGGPAGIRTALEASEDGARVVLVDDQPELGGSLLSLPAGSGREPQQWLDPARGTLDGRDDVTVLRRSSAVGLYDHGYLVVLERRTDHLDDPPAHLSRERLWHIRARRVVLATGAQQRPLLFPDNDRPGVMLADAVRTYLNRYAAVPGDTVVVATVDDTAYQVALDLAAAGVAVPALVDARPQPPAALAEALTARGVEVLPGATVTGTRGPVALTAVDVHTTRQTRTIPCDVLAVSGGWTPDLALFAQAGGTTRWDAAAAAFVPDVAPPGVEVMAEIPRQAYLPADADPEAREDAFVDLQRDATVADVVRAHGTGMRSVEHVKRYTTIGTGSDQGRTSGVNAAAVLAAAMGLDSPAPLGLTGFRPPATPVSFAALAGRDVGHLADPARTTAIHAWHVAAGAVFEDVGQWKRPRYYPRDGEDMAAAVHRECTAARTGVAMMDVSTLGRIEVVGADAPEFLNRMYTNAFAKLAVGSARYGVMCTADGMVFDDGVVVRLADDRFHLTTTTGNAAAVLAWLEEWLQTEWPELDVALTSVTEQLATVAVVGPRARDVVSRLAPRLDCGNDAFPFMTFRETVLAGDLPSRVARISFSGELAYELSVVSWHGTALWRTVLRAGADLGITPYGTETMHVLRAEKAYPIVGQDTDGTVTPLDLGMDWVVSKRKDFVGKRSLRRLDTARADRKHLVGLLPVDPEALLAEGAQLVTAEAPGTMVGHVTSSYRSAALGRTFALALVTGGRDRVGETVVAPLGERPIHATVHPPVLFDPGGTRRDG